MAIGCKNIEISYGSNIIINDISFTINDGDYLAVFGENGAGKSSLIKCICSISNNFKGQINVSDDILKDGISYLSQSTNIQKDFPASVMEIVKSGLIKKNLFFHPLKNDIKSVLKYIDLLSISHLKNKSFKELSGGQQQRVLLARALVGSAKTLILDEPFNSLDPIVSSELYKLLKRLNKTIGLTIIIVSHQRENILPFVNKVLHIDRDKYIFCNKDEYIENSHYKNLVKEDA